MTDLQPGSVHHHLDVVKPNRVLERLWGALEDFRLRWLGQLTSDDFSQRAGMRPKVLPSSLLGNAEIWRGLRDGLATPQHAG
jgi:hypothetical protein